MREAVAAFGWTTFMLLASCATEEFSNAPPEVVDDCRREVALLTDRELIEPQDDLRGPALESTPDPVEDARRAKEATGGADLPAWPADALMYRCLESRGVVLTQEQARILAEWSGDLDQDDGAPRSGE